MVFPTICLVTYPFMISTISLMMRTLRDINEFTLSIYIQFTAILIYAPIAFCQSDFSFSFMAPLGGWDWAIVVATGFSSTSVYLCLQKAAQYEEPAKLAFLNFFQSVLGFITDFIFFNTPFVSQ